MHRRPGAENSDFSSRVKLRRDRWGLDQILECIAQVLTESVEIFRFDGFLEKMSFEYVASLPSPLAAGPAHGRTWQLASGMLSLPPSIPDSDGYL